jgi:hypothetical protein
MTTAMSSLPDHLQKVVLQLEAGLKHLYGDRYRGLLLYGSYARGTAWEGSDVDLLLLLKGPVNVGREIVATEPIVCSLSLDSGLLLAVMPADFETYQRGGTIFLRSVRKEAIPVAA